MKKTYENPICLIMGLPEDILTISLASGNAEDDIENLNVRGLFDV